MTDQKVLAQYDKFFTMSLDLLCIAGTDGTFKHVNPAFTRVLGYSPEELISRPFLEFIHPDDRELTQREIAKLATGQLTIHFEHRFLHRDGSVRIFSWSASPDPTTGLLYAAARDVTAQRESELKLNQTDAALNTHAIVAVTDLAGRITEANDKFCEISGYSRAELIGQTHRLLCSGRHSKEFFKDLWKTISSGNSWSGVIENRRKNGESYWVQSVISPLRNAQGAISGYMAIRFDITGQKRAELETQELARKLEQAEVLAKIGFWDLDLSNLRGNWSKGQLAVFGLEQADSSPSFEHLMGIVHPDDRAMIKEKFNSILQERRREFEFEFRILLGDGVTVRWLKEYGKLSLGADGSPVRLSGTVQDITEVKVSEIRLKRALKILNETGKMAKVGGWEVDLATGVRTWTDATFSIFEMQPTATGEPNTRDALSSFTPKSKALLESALKRAIEEGQPYSLELESMTTKGNLIWIQTVGQANRVNGKITSISGTIQDVTSRVQAEALLKQANIKLIQSSKLASLGEMSAGVAHEINNPLAIIGATISLLPQSIGDPEKFQLRLESIKKACARIAKIVNGLRKFSRSSEQSSFRNHALSRIIKESLILTEAKARLSETTVTTEIRTDSMILCDEVEIEQVLVNLINNAMDAVKSASKSKDARWVKVQLYDELESVVLRVIDSGCGIPESVRAKLFDPFFTTKNVGEGTGLGLSITKGILDSHHASISVVTDMPNTCFELRFKRAESARIAA